jgi:hypothetical protein
VANVEIRRAVPQPYEQSVSSSISFEVDIAHTKRQEAIVNIEGWLESDDGKMLAKIGLMPQTKTQSSEVAARGSMFDSDFKETIYNTTLIAPLDQRALSYIEDRRMKNKKRDVFLTLCLHIKSVVTKATVSHFHEIADGSSGIPSLVNVSSSSGRRTQGRILAYGPDSQFSTQFTSLWIISGDGSPVFLTINDQILKKEGIRIPSVDWIHDFEPKLGLGEYFIVEIPKGKGVVKEAWDYVEKAEECYRQWDTKGAYANCREVGKLLDRTINRKFRNDPITKKWKRAIEKFETLTSLDLHEEDIKEQEPKGEISIGRPEAEHILIVTKAMIKYAEELLEEKS